MGDSIITPDRPRICYLCGRILAGDRPADGPKFEGMLLLVWNALANRLDYSSGVCQDCKLIWRTWRSPLAGGAIRVRVYRRRATFAWISRARFEADPATRRARRAGERVRQRARQAMIESVPYARRPE